MSEKEQQDLHSSICRREEEKWPYNPVFSAISFQLASSFLVRRKQHSGVGQCSLTSYTPQYPALSRCCLIIDPSTFLAASTAVKGTESGMKELLIGLKHTLLLLTQAVRLGSRFSPMDNVNDVIATKWDYYVLWQRRPLLKCTIIDSAFKTIPEPSTQ